MRIFAVVFLIVFLFPHPVQVPLNLTTIESFYDLRATLINRLFADEDVSAFALERGDEGTWFARLPLGYASTIRVVGSGRPALWHTGHGGLTETERAGVQALIDAGWQVYILDMPMIGVNPPLTVTLPSVGQVTLTEHDHLPLIENQINGHPLRLFVQPVIAVLNHVAEPVTMVGLSGGGWTTTLTAALDERIAAHVEIAGSAPFAVRSWSTDASRGDYEQYTPSFYTDFDYTDLYAMSVTNGRKRVQILNFQDDCCFPSWQALHTVDALRQAQMLTGGTIEVLIAPTRWHIVHYNTLIAALQGIW